MIMKNLYINMAFIFVLLLITASCSDKDDSAPRVIPTMNLTVSEIADNTALITSEQQTGTTFGVKFVEENGEPVSLPYTRKITEGLRPGVNYISAIIAYNAEGRAVCSAFQTWKASGTEGAWSDGGSAGDLEENEWSRMV